LYKNIIFFTLFFVFVNLIHADKPTNIEDFESLLANASQVATKKSINVDYLPSVVTVIDAQTFIDGGIQTIAEALDMLPGIQMQFNYIGQPITNIRGFKNPNSTLSDKIKILVDGVAINNEATTTSGFYLDLPIKLVQKIELLRGPGSTIYGAGAFYGAINIITKLGSNTDTDQIYAGLGSYNYLTAGGNLHTTVDNWKIYTDAYYSKNNKSLKDYTSTSHEKMRNISLGIKVSNAGFEFLTRYKASHYGNFFIPKGNLQPNKDDGHKDNYFFAQLAYKTQLNDFKLETKFNYSHRESKLNAYFSTDNVGIAQLFQVVDVTLNDAYYVEDNQIEQNIGAEVLLTLPKIASNDINFVAGIRKTTMPKDYFYSSIENAIATNLDKIKNSPNYEQFRFKQKNEPAYWKDPTSNKIFNNTDRTITYLSMQDLMTLNNKIDLILGARVDNYSDIGLKYSSKAALVYRANDKLIFKLLYGSAFRAPSFTEAYSKGHIDYRAGDKNMKPEETQTYESAIIYKPNLNNRISMNIYYSKLSNVIDLEELEGTEAGYQNMKDRASEGLEFEYFYRTKKEHNLYFNASYIMADYTIPKDSSTPAIDQSMPDISKIMFKAMYIYTPITKLSFGTVWRYFSKTTKTKLAWIVSNKDKIPQVGAQNIFDETITYRLSGATNIRFIIKNIFNEEVRTPSYYYDVKGGNLRDARNYYFTYTQTF